jgi:hypothetical protein
MKLQLGARLGQVEQLAPQLIMQANHLPNGRRGEALEKAAQRGLIGEGFQTEQGEEQAIVLENLGLVHPLDAGDQDVEERQDDVLRAVIDPVGRGSKHALEAAAQAQLVTKSLDQEQATEVSQGIAIKRKVQCLQAFRHCHNPGSAQFRPVSQSSHLVNVVTPTQKAGFGQQNQ